LKIPLKDLNEKLNENDPRELHEKIENFTTENKLIKEQLNARENQLTSLQTRLSELEHENEMMSDRDDQIITLRQS